MPRYLPYVSTPTRTFILFFFFFNDTATTEIYTLSLHDALPICRPARRSAACRAKVGTRDSRLRATFGAGDEGSRAGRAQLVVAGSRRARSADDGAGAGLGRPGGRRERVSREESSQMVGPLKNVAPLGGVTVLDFTQIELGPCW